MRSILTSSLLGATMLAVGAIAFSGHQLYLPPDQRIPLAAETIETYWPADAPGAATPDERLNSLLAVEGEVWQILERYGQRGPEQRIADRRRIERLHEKLLSRQQSLVEHPDTTDELRRRGQMAQLRCDFAAAEVLPDLFGNQFQEIVARTVTKTPNSPEAMWAEFLVIYRAPTFAIPVSPIVLAELDRLAKSNRHHPLGPAMFAIVSRQFWLEGDLASAKKVLKHGMQTFAGDSCVATLVNQMADQQLHPLDNVVRSASTWQALAIAMNEATAAPTSAME